MLALVDEILAEQSKPYIEIQKDRIASDGPQRIGSTFKLREEFFSAMWLYMFKANYILKIDPENWVENMNRPDVNLMNKAGEDSKDSQAATPILVPDSSQKENNDSNQTSERELIGTKKSQIGIIEEEKKEKKLEKQLTQPAVPSES